MTLLHRFFPLAVATLLPAALHAASAELEAEYAQVRKIAMKDPGVRAAYAKADSKLNAKMIEIDPALKPLVERGGVAPAPVARRAATRKPLRGASSTGHVVAKGDTLTSIAARHRVTASELKSANGIVDERKLQVGQKLTIPAPARPAPKKPEEGLWSRLKSGL